MAAAAMCSSSAALQLGPDGLGGRAKTGRRWVSPSGSAQIDRIGFDFFPNLFLMQKQFHKF
jgi:hypothetical protein